MPRGRRPTTDTIPRLDKVDYLFETLRCVSESLTFDEIRRELIHWRQQLDRTTGNDLRHESAARLRRLRDRTPIGFWANTRDALRELMRLGMVARAPLPHLSTTLGEFGERRFELTVWGRRFLDLGLEEGSGWEFRDRFFCAVEAAHPYLKRLRARLEEGDLWIPRVARTDIPGDVKDWMVGPPEPLDALSQSICKEMREKAGASTDWVTFQRILSRNLAKTWEKRNYTLLRDNKALSHWVVKTMNEQIVQAVAQASAIPIDFVAFRYAVSLLADLHICWGTRALPDANGSWVIWPTASGQPLDGDNGQGPPAAMALRQPIWIHRHIVPEPAVAATTVEAIMTDPKKGGGFSLIHEIRARVCHDLKIHGWLFDRVLRSMVEGGFSDESHAIHVDGGAGHQLLPSEEAFMIGDRAYYLVTLMRRTS